MQALKLFFAVTLFFSTSLDLISQSSVKNGVYTGQKIKKLATYKLTVNDTCAYLEVFYTKAGRCFHYINKQYLYKQGINKDNLIYKNDSGTLLAYQSKAKLKLNIKEEGTVKLVFSNEKPYESTYLINNNYEYLLNQRVCSNLKKKHDFNVLEFNSYYNTFKLEQYFNLSIDKFKSKCDSVEAEIIRKTSNK